MPPDRGHVTADGIEKRGYTSKRAAKGAAVRATAQGGPPRTVYRCRVCPLWHVGHPNRERTHGVQR